MKNLLKIVVAAALALALPAQAQFTPGQVLTAAQLNAQFALKTTNTAAAITGGTISGLSSPIPIASGGTGATFGSSALSNMGMGTMGFQNASAVSITGGSITGLTTPLAVANGGTGATSGSGTLIDNLSGFSGTGFIQRTGSGTYAFVSATNGITYSNLAQAPANSVLANVTGSTANVAAFTMPSCGAVNDALQFNPGTGWFCATTFGYTGSPLSQFAATTSAQLAGIISDGTGSGSLVFGTSPTIASPHISSPTFSGTITGMPGRLLNIQVFGTPGTYTYIPTSGANSVVVEVLGGGGGGAATTTTAASQSSYGCGGASGSYAKVLINSATSQTVVVGAAGAGGVTNSSGGTAGGTSSFGAYVSSPGGGASGTSIVAAVNAVVGVAGGVGGGNPTIAGVTTTLVSTNGNTADYINLNLSSGAGASSLYGSGGTYHFSATVGSNASGNGAGGGGAAAQASTAFKAGGNGSSGLVIVYEYQ